MYRAPQFHYSWIGPPVETHEQLIPGQTRRATYDSSETIFGSLLARRIQIFRLHFYVIYFLSLFQNNLSNYVRTKMYPEESDSLR